MKKTEIKCVVWDLDNTLWDGILLETDQVILKSGMREIIQELDARGILQSVCSKNDYDLALSRLKDFGIDEYFLYPQINWGPKSASLKCLQEQLRIGMDTLMLVDDQVFERDEVNATYPEVLCFDALDYQQLLALPHLQPRFITEEARNRRQMYIAEMQREHDEQRYVETPEHFLRTLGLKFSIERAREADLQRVEELTVRTNQLNTTGTSYSYEELDQFRQSDQHLLLICELTDKYGSYGKIGIALIETQPTYWRIKLLLMSCRVISRGVGTVLLTSLARRCQQEHKRLLADFRQTGRNKMMFVSYRFANFKEIATEEDGMLLMENALNAVPAFPPHIEVKEAY